MREQRGEAVDAEAALQAESGKPGGRSRMDLANRLKQRKERQRQGHTLYSGFVSPYNTQSRVFDANELRRAATQVSCALICITSLSQWVFCAFLGVVFRLIRHLNRLLVYCCMQVCCGRGRWLLAASCASGPCVSKCIHE